MSPEAPGVWANDLYSQLCHYYELQTREQVGSSLPVVPGDGWILLGGWTFIPLLFWCLEEYIEI